MVGKKAIVIEAFFRALRMILADSAGFDSSDPVSRLRAAHYDGRSDAGLGESSSNLRGADIAVRHEPGDDWFHARAWYCRELHVEEASSSEC